MYGPFLNMYRQVVHEMEVMARPKTTRDWKILWETGDHYSGAEKEQLFTLVLKEC